MLRRVRGDSAVLEFVKRRVRGNHQDDAGDIAPQEPEAPRPLIGLALGGGSARGFAHIGVLRTLLANGITPDVITGTSIGAVVGGVYAAGRLDRFEDWARSLTRRRIFGYLDFNLAGSGLIGGARLADSLIGEVADIRIEDLPLRFAAIATEIGTGHEIWLTHGRLAEALGASYALPGIFPPALIGSRWLMDGALVNPVPVSAARALGARVVIAVNLNSDNFGRGTVIQNHGASGDEAMLEPEPKSAKRSDRSERLMRRQLLGTPGRPALSTVMVEAFNVMQDRITRARLAGDPPDVLIGPRTGNTGFFDFHRADETIQLGVEATEKALDAIRESVGALA